ncbi:hypothetical protein DFJ63DRAFT_318972 [Scheffersomyces coipomensis]|uniref:uncharacterized protein n=1 Tax=Scheffersomyces coipomensis TaxID=1788519 RepID=UPI00315DA737
MSHTSIINLLPPPPPQSSSTSTPISIALKLNNIILDHFNHCLSKSITPKLLVRNGQYFVKISDDVIFPCNTIPENLNFDIYSTNPNDKGDFQGRIETKLNVLNDSKNIKQISKLKVSPSSTTTNSSAFTTSSLPASPKISLTPASTTTTSATTTSRLNNGPKRSSSSLLPFKINSNDSNSEITRKFLNLIALGPITESTIMKTLHITEHHVDLIADLISNLCQIYNPSDSFIQDSRFPNQELSNISNSSDDDQFNLIPKYILKDKSYKDLKPWKWNFTDFERDLIINNINHSLTRLGYSETHPLRNKICLNPELNNNDASSSSSDDDNHNGSSNSSNGKTHKKQSSLGGGILISKNNKSLPFRKSQTDSPKLSNLKRVGGSGHTNLSTGGNTSALGSPKPKPSTGVTSTTTTSSTTAASTNTKSAAVKRKLSISSASSSASNSSDEERHSKRPKPDSYTSPSSEEDDSHTTNVSAPPMVTTTTSRPNTPNPTTKKLDYYTNLAVKFKSKYKEYESLYNQLKSNSPVKNPSLQSSNSKKQLMKLLELHTTLAQWKKTLWDYNNSSLGKSSINGLSKHKKAQSLSPAILDNSQLFPPRPPSRQITPSIPQSGSSKLSHKHKLSLDY